MYIRPIMHLVAILKSVRLNMFHRKNVKTNVIFIIFLVFGLGSIKISIIHFKISVWRVLCI